MKTSKFFFITILSLFTISMWSCKKPVESVTVKPAIVELEVGSTYQLAATVLPSNASQKLEWTSSRPAVATVNSQGLLTALSVGYCEIMVYASDKSDVCRVKVVEVGQSGNDDWVDPEFWTDPDNAMTVHFGDITWTARDVYADVQDVQSLDVIYIAGSENYNDDYVPWICGRLGATVGGTNYNLAHAYVIGYYENVADVDAQGFGLWQATAAEQSINALDLNAKTVSASVTQIMRNQTTGVSGVPMYVIMKNVTWEDRALAPYLHGTYIPCRQSKNKVKQ